MPRCSNKNKHLNKKGFSLIEVIVGIAVLTVAIVASGNLLSGLTQSNRDNLTTLQAYYLAQEGLEAVRNIRDSNWLNHRDWLGDDGFDVWDENFEVGADYALDLKYSAFTGEMGNADADVSTVRVFSPWTVLKNDEGVIGRRAEGDNVLLTSEGGEPTLFSRIIELREAPESEIGENAILVNSVVRWKLGEKERELKLSTILTNWKDGVL